MDSAAQLALMAKARLVFSADDTFLSFPVTPIAFRKEALDLLGEDSLGRLIAFSALVNLIPDGSAWAPEGDLYLWDACALALNEGRYAASSRTDAEEAAYQRARDMLFSTRPDGGRTATPAALAYRAHRDQYLLLQQEYLAHKITMESATDPAQKDEWKQIVEPALLRGIDEALSAWEQQGFRYEVEDAEAQMRMLGAKSPLLTRQEWADRFDPDTCTLTRAEDQLRVYPTSFVPNNALDDTSWRPFRLSGAEIEQARTQTPLELRERLGGGQTNDVLGIDFEFSSASLLRPWFSSEVFKARFWRFDDGRPPLSDGAQPGEGLCPAYASAVVFARNIRVQRKTAPHATPGSPYLAFDLIKLGGRRQTPRTTILDAVRRLRASEQVQAQPAQGGHLRVPLARPEGVPLARRIAASPRILPAAVSAMSAPRATLRDGSFVRSVLSARPTPSHVAPEASDDSIYILAFICKAVPKCPDPDEGLRW